MERAAGAGLRADPDAPAVALGDLLTDRKPDAGPGVLAHRMQALEQHEDALEVLRLDADAVVGDADVPLAGLLHRADMDVRPRRAAELERIADQVLEDLREPHHVAVHGGQRVQGDRGTSSALLASSSCARRSSASACLRWVTSDPTPR